LQSSDSKTGNRTEDLTLALSPPVSYILTQRDLPKSDPIFSGGVEDTVERTLQQQAVSRSLGDKLPNSA
jgi:hypothetical protein